MDERFGKEYKLCSKKRMGLLFAKNRSVKKYPFVLLYNFTEEPLPKPFQITVSVPKKHFKRAVDRNLLKRRTREIIRKEKGPLEDLLSKNGKYLALFLVYTSNEKMKSSVLKKKFQKLIQDLIGDIHEEISL